VASADKIDVHGWRSSLLRGRKIVSCIPYLLSKELTLSSASLIQRVSSLSSLV
jgi:hypothetical protein